MASQVGHNRDVPVNGGIPQIPTQRLPFEDRAPGEMQTRELERAGLLVIGAGCSFSTTTVFRPFDQLGKPRPIVFGDGCSVGAFAIVHGGTELAEGVRVEDHVILGQPERGYAVRELHPGAGARTTLATGVVLRAYGIVYAGAAIGADTVIGHHTLLRSQVRVGGGSQLGHHLTVERRVRIGSGVRCSPASHLTSETEIADDVFLGAGIKTINDNGLIWRQPDGEAPLVPPRFERGCRVGSGTTVLGGVVIGEHALVGAGAVVVHDVPAYAIAYGNPATVHGSRTPGGVQ